MRVWVRLLLFVLLLGAVAAVTFYVCDHFLRQSVAGPVNYHYCDVTAPFRVEG
ncbi:MAG TPA: hypothetical protein VMS23_04855 [Terrimicrobiaceae bacterium]|nr:hypothetical protein [Terrimicrobiaceae bacterium]